MVYGNGKFVAVAYGSDQGAYSSDGTNWSSSTLPASAGWTCVSYGNGVFVALQSYSTNGVYSGDGIHWTNTGPLPYNAYWQCMTYGNGVFAALVGGSGHAAYSPNGIVWSNATGLPSDNWSSITYGNGMFVAMAYDSSTTAYSSNGITWYSGTNSTTDAWFSSAYADGIFAAAGLGTTNASYSTNGMDWLASPTGLPHPDNFYTLGSASPVSPGYITDGLVAYWKLNDGSGTNAMDSSGNNITMPLLNGPYSWGSNYLSFNSSSNQYGDAGTSPLEITNHDMSICAWINKLGNSEKGILDKTEWGVPGLSPGGWGLWVTNLHPMFVTSASEIDNGIGTIQLGQWIFISVVYHYGTTTVDFYINGLLNSSLSTGTPINYPTAGYADVQLGNLHNNLSSGEFAFDGSMHDVAVYNQALTVAQIQSNFFLTQLTTNAAVPVPDLLEYKMTEGSASISVPQFLTDSSSHGGTVGTYPIFNSEVWSNGVGNLPYTSLHFGGVGAYLETSNSTLFNFTTNLYTINLWVYPQNQNSMLVQNQDSGPQDGWYMFLTGAGAIQFGTENGGSLDFLQTPNSLVPTLAWTMITVTRSSLTNTTIYLNGVPTANANLQSASSSTASLKFAIDYVGSRAYDGNVWLPQIWSSPLSAQQIATLYLIEKSGFPWP
jgi:hypothetical protein